MIILGIDPAIRTTGYGVIDAGPGGKFSVIDCGVIANSQKLPHSQCVRRLHLGICELVNTFHPDCAVLEEPFVGKNAGTAIILGMARGAILAALSINEIPAFAYAPTVAKRAAVGRGSATKEQIAVMISAELGIETDQIPLDSTDALALAMCHASRVLRSGAVPGREL
ncbi:MAG: crossover junction endodeoxyribonuclease RuvC [Lentisphaeria bacterium]|nr:crossover junction endodeoxyribonuclease RuvC [Lentisphaeria bacterium]